MKKRAVPVIAVLAVAIVVAPIAIHWRSIVVRAMAARLDGDHLLQREWLSMPGESIRGQAVEVFFRERPLVLVRRLIAEVGNACNGVSDPNLEGMKRARIGLGRQEDRSLGAWFIYERPGGGVSGSSNQWMVIDDRRHRILDLILKTPGDRMLVQDDEARLRFTVTFPKGRMEGAMDEYAEQVLVTVEKF